MSPLLFDRPQVSLFDQPAEKTEAARAALFGGAAAPTVPTAATASPAAPAAAPADERPAASTTAVAVDGRARLEDVIFGVWEDLVVHRTAACVVCGGRMAPRYGAAGHAPVGGRCTDCGSSII